MVNIDVDDARGVVIVLPANIAFCAMKSALAASLNNYPFMDRVHDSLEEALEKIGDTPHQIEDGVYFRPASGDYINSTYYIKGGDVFNAFGVFCERRANYDELNLERIGDLPEGFAVR